MKFEPNQIIDDRYRIIAKLDEGGMGAVWKATDSRTNDSVVVLKFPLKYRDPEILQRFAHEASTMRELAGDCDNILDIQDIGSVPVNDIDNVPYYVMRFQTGGALRDWKPAADQDGTPIFTRESLDWVNGVARALDFLHHQKVPVYHRDVKPENILFNATGTPKLSDFGIVKNIKKATTTITQTGAAMGTVAYMPPEIWRGGDFSPASDQFSFAATVYEMIAGQRPYEGETPFAMLESLSKGHQNLRDTIGLPRRASDTLDRALSHEPDQRFESCGAFADAFLDGFSDSGTPVGNLSELPTGMHMDTGMEKSSNQEVIGGRRVDMVELPASRGKPFKSLMVVGAILLLVGLAGGGLFFSGLLSPMDHQPDSLTATKFDSPTTPVTIVPVGTPTEEAEGEDLPSEPVEASFELAQKLFSGTGGQQKDKPHAISMFEELAQEGSLESQKRLAEIYVNGEFGEIDFENAFTWLLMAAEQGDAESQMAVGVSYSTGQRGASRDLKEAVKWLKRSAAQDHGAAQMILGVHYSRGLGVEEDLDEAQRWLELALSSGEVEAKSLLAELKARTMKELPFAEYTQSPSSLVEEHADHGFATAQVNLGLRYRDGSGVRRSASESAKWFRKAANQGDKAGQYNLGICYANGTGVGKDAKEANRWLRKSANTNYGPAMLKLGQHYADGIGVEEDLDEAKRWLELSRSSGISEATELLADLEKRMIKELSYKQYEASSLSLVRDHATKGFTGAQVNLASREYDNGNYGLALEWARKAAKKNSPRGQYWMGMVHVNSPGVEQNLAEGRQWLRKAAIQGHSRAQYILGSLYSHDKAGPMTGEESIMWLRKAAEQGERDAYTNLAYMYEEAKGVARDYAEALRMAKKAAALGSRYAQNNVGAMYADGKGVPKDFREAIRWYRKAADHGYALAQYNLGKRYMNGEGVSRDDGVAVRWFRRAAAQGHAGAKKELKRRGLN